MTKTGAPITFHTEPCTRCNGEGRIEQYRHIDGGRCAKCHGNGRQLSRTGRAAHRAHQQAITERLGRRADKIEIGQTILDSYGTARRIDQIDHEDGLLLLVTVEPGSKSTTARRPRDTVRLYDPAAEAEVAADIAARYPGATLAA